ncbi:MAG: hypothetical protein FJ279_08540 [Planctomycetes bacterium]|nr:hypothetical protein [Planctomycetota bacterium]MBM4078844.1 hypothetical protein [Planctomycetota bacterium]
MPDRPLRGDSRADRLHRRAVQVVLARFGLISNNRWLITNPEFFTEAKEIQSLLSDVYEVKEVPFKGLDACLHLLDLPDAAPSVHVSEREIAVVADLTRLDREVKDRRYSVFGNLGLFFKYSMATLERCHDIYSFHASSLYVPERHELIIVAGPPAAGKTVFLLEGLVRGYQIFSAEMTHFRLEGNKCTFFKGALWDNIRLGNFIYDFPQAVERLKLRLPKVQDVWATKIPVSLHKNAPKADTIVNPTVSLLFPKIEAGRDKAIVSDVTDKRKLAKMVFDNLTEKIAGTTLLYECLPVGSLDAPDLMARRLATAQRFVNYKAVPIKQAKTILAGAKNCMEGVS